MVVFAPRAEPRKCPIADITPAELLDALRRVDLIQSAKTREEAFAHLNSALLDYGYDRCAYTLATDHPSSGLKATHGHAASFPNDWLDHYNERGYNRVDPVWQQAVRSLAPFFWGEAVDRLKADPSVPEDRLKAGLLVINEGVDAGLADGICMSYTNLWGEIASVTMSRSQSDKERRYEDMAELFLLATLFHEKFRGFFAQPEQPHLTAREREVLLWATESKTDAEIGAILGVTPRTIRFHWSNIFNKLGVHGRMRAVVMAIQLRLINPQLIRPPCQA